MVTGSGGGLGAAIAADLVSRGWTVAGCDLGASGPTGDRLDYWQTDITDQAQVDRFWRAVAEKYDGRIDGLVNNASIYGALSPKGPWASVPMEEWDLVMRVNVRGTWQMTGGAIPLLTANGGGSIVNISSGTNRGGSAGYPHYVASKGAVEGLTRAGATELGSVGIRVNAVAPGLVATDATLGRTTAERREVAAQRNALHHQLVAADIVGTVAFLLSPDSAVISGQTIAVDGGEHYL